MHSVESRRDEDTRGPFDWVLPLAFVVFVLVLSWTGVFVVVNDLIEAASHATIADTVHE